MSAPVILIEAAVRRIADGAAETVRLAGGGAERPYRYGGEHWRAGIAALPTISAGFSFDGEGIASGLAAAMEIHWAPARGADLDSMAAYYWPDAQLTVRIGPETIDGSLPAVVQTGRSLDSAVEQGALKIAFADPAADLKRPLLDARFAGTGGIEGPPEWDGMIRRRGWGRVFNVQGDAIDKANNIYCFGDPARRWQAFDAVRDKGAAAAALTVLAWQGSAEATFAALQAAEAPAGGGVAAPDIACVKWWTEPAGALCADVRGEIAGGYAETAAEIAQRIVSSSSGIAFTAGTVAAAAGARPGAAGWFADDENMTAAAMLDELLGGVSLLWLLDDAGAITIRPIEWGASVAAARSQDVRRRKVFKPIGRRRVGYRRNHHVMSRGDIAGAVLVGDIVGLGKGATADDLAQLDPGAANKLGGIEDGATKGAIVGTGNETGNLYRPGGGTYTDDDIETSKGTSNDTSNVAGVPAEDVIARLGAAEGEIDSEIERLDGRIDDANQTAADIETALTDEAARLDGRIDGADAAVAAARVRLGREVERLTAEVGLTRVGQLAETKARITAVSAQVTRIDGIVATLDDPDTGLAAVNALVATLQSVTVDTENPSSLASQLAVVQASLDGLEDDLGARVTALESASTQQADDLADLAGDVQILDGDLVAAQQDIADNAGGLVALGSRTDTVEAELDAQGDDIGAVQASLTDVTQAVALQDAAGLYLSQLASARVGLTQVSRIAETRIRATENMAAVQRLDAIELDLDDGAGGGALADIASLTTAVADLESGKASVDQFTALSTTVTGQGDRLTTAEGDIDDQDAALLDIDNRVLSAQGDIDGLDARVGTAEGEIDAIDTRLVTAEGSISDQASLISGLDLDLDNLSGSLSTVAADLAALDGRVDDVEGVTATLVTTTNGLSARVDTVEEGIDGLDTRQTLSEGAISDMQAVGVTERAAVVRQGEYASARVGLSQIATAAERVLRVTGESAIYDAIETVDLKITTPDTGLNARLGTAESAIVDLTTGKADVSTVTTLSAEVDGLATSKADVTYVDSAVADEASARASAIGGLDARMDDAEAEITTVQQVAADAQGTANALVGLKIDVNGNISGWTSENDGDRAKTTFLNDVFEILGDTGARTEFSDGNWRVYDSTNTLRVRLGVWS